MLSLGAGIGNSLQRRVSGRRIVQGGFETAGQRIHLLGKRFHAGAEGQRRNGLVAVPPGRGLDKLPVTVHHGCGQILGAMAGLAVNRLSRSR